MVRLEAACKSEGTLFDELSQEPGVHKSRVEFTGPPDEGTNLARELFHAFKRHASKVLLVDAASGHQWTGSDLYDHSARLATGLVRRLGLQPNDTLLTICDHNGQEVAAVMGAIVAGAAIFGTSPKDGYAELKTLCTIVRPNYFLVNQQYHQLVVKLRHEMPELAGAKIIWLEGEQAECSDEPDALVSDLLASAADFGLVHKILFERIVPEEHILCYMLTSGSTGRPKVVPSSHRESIQGLYSMISAATNPFESVNAKANSISRDANNNETGPERLTEHLLPISSDDIISGDLPLDHGAGLNMMFISLWLGAKFVVMRSYDVDAFWQAVTDYKITFSLASTTFCFRLMTRLKEALELNEAHRWNLDSLRSISCCGAKLAFTDLVRQMQQHYPRLQFGQAYGCTEIGFISMVPPSECHSHLDSVGYLFPGLLAKLVKFESPNEEPIAGSEERGELLLWSRAKFTGYRCEPNTDAHQIYANCHDSRLRFYRTGDQAHLDRAGRIYVHGRYKDTLCLMEDWKILPAELEDLINEHPLVEMSAVVGVPDPNLPGCHAPKAFVKLIKPQCGALRELSSSERQLCAWLEAGQLKPIAAHIYNFVASRTARPKHLTGGVRILAEFPRVGLLNKVDRKALKQMD